MKKVFTLGFLWILLFLAGAGFAQDLSIKGKVQSADGYLPGASILIKGTSRGSTTDANGDFTLSAPANATLVVSFIGYKTMEIPVGSKTVFDITLENDATQFNEIVVTALGIAREKKALGYAVQEVSGKTLTQARETNLVNSLSGRLAGVQVTNSNGAPGSSSRMIIRGASSIGSNNQPLFVVDGVPVDNSNFGSGTGIDYGNAAASINPDDVESINVLKGPSAAALYGSRGANGVVLITTKSGKGTKGIGVSFNSNTAFESPFRLPKWQNEYGQGAKGLFSYVDGTGAGVNDGVDESWGPKLDGRLLPQFDSPIAADGTRTPTPWIAHPDNVDKFFETGRTLTNNVAITGANDKGDFRLSFTDLDQTGILPNTNYKRRTVSLNAGWNLTKKLSIRATGNYVNDGSDNRNNFGLYFIWFGRQVDMDKLKDYHKPGSIYQYNWNDNYWTNPYYLLNESTRANERDRLYGNMSATYKFTDWLSLTARTGTDFYEDRRKTKTAARQAKIGASALYDAYNEEQIFVRESNSDFLLNATHKFGEFDITANIGGNHRSNYAQRNYMGATELAIPRVYNLGNSRQRPVTENSFIRKNVNSLYASANLGFRNYLFVDLTARNDWSSSLPSDNRSYFYPSAAVSAIITDIFDVKSPVLSFAKLRAGWARVGNDTDPYRLASTYKYENPWGSTPSLSENNALLNANLKPELTSSYEIGTDIRLWQNRIGLDITYYKKVSSNQILDVNISNATGYLSKLLNAGKIENQGIEIQLTASPVKTEAFEWQVGLNWARNKNKVVSLANNLTTYQLNTSYNPLTQTTSTNSFRGLSVEARVGQPYGTFFGKGFLRAPDGQIVYDAQGYPMLESSSRVLGNFTPDWIGGFSNTFRYKNLSLSTLIDVKHGGDIFSQSINIGRYTGVLAETTLGREDGIVGQGVVNKGTAAAPEYVPNEKRISSEEYHHKYYLLTNNENTIFDASYVKLREVKLTYMLSGQVFKKLPFRDIAISVVGRNLALLKSNLPHIDPETSYYNDGNLQGIENGQIPTTRTVGFNISFNL
ncbi:TonB-linked SusC/RagA family outer membrane protein [Dyadobacter sp. BE34]|uniref:TonB-linked SusC/RagA family outer membrane protein n=1 Tax=Dyadobacter fermentans TaxID=94254 RepID=A0ABU1R4J4_9BACT|nr:MULTISPECIES: SusC/RagA family TonB-linked outer membrane protein [Dyadobacter]MDR6808341.1 TonB-linked SusC/RagA family outer membrane protein [Dyadobacter fermentans]MDR7045842.1 TonB-linked SusC/RagA family outer membrane protein [Dyadobacter sp. BE242]MDR7200155.1 TonB-linked SusC/RagA family outer membrane protein [Dyadobacter sp. BE34]MDR7218115.1 TonB-linked SusC/RagA family outer membrane protein [Dyadobacter sp. BE31]MDR7266046.1 TonB-linked SusC/RagA family outer membrane protein 